MCRVCGYYNEEKAVPAIVCFRALQYNDPVKIYLHMISLLESLGRWKDLDLMSTKMLKKQGLAKDLWIRYLTSLYIRDRKTADLKGALHFNSDNRDLSTRNQIQETLTRSLNRLPSSTHIELRTTAARLEFKFGQPERYKHHSQRSIPPTPKEKPQLPTPLSCRARGMFATILEAVPKRTDVWNVLFDAQLMSLKKGKNSPAEIS